MRSVRLVLAVAFLLMVSSLDNIVYAQSPFHTLTAQGQGDRVPLKPWSAPLYWQATHAESQATIGNARALSPRVSNSNAAGALPTETLVFVGVTPCRLVDTRNGFGFTGPFGPPSLAANASRTFPIQSSPTCSIPSTAQAYSLNITVVPPGFLNYITVWPTGQTQPNASTLNDPLGTIVANAAIVPAGNSGSIDVYASNTTDIVIDINGYYVAEDCVKGFDEAFAAHQAAYTLVQNAITPFAAFVQAQLRVVADPTTGNQGTYQALLTTAHNVANSYTNGRIVIALPDGTVVIDTGKPDDPGNTMSSGNSFQHFVNKTVNENHNSRISILLAQESLCGIGIETKVSTTTGNHESYYAIRLGNHLDNDGTFRGSTF